MWLIVISILEKLISQIRRELGELLDTSCRLELLFDPPTTIPPEASNSAESNQEVLEPQRERHLSCLGQGFFRHGSTPSLLG